MSARATMIARSQAAKTSDSDRQAPATRRKPAIIGRVRADSIVQARAAQRVVVNLIEALGLPAGSVEVRFDAHAADETRRAGARGLAMDGVVSLDARRVPPDQPEGRHVIAHELAHVAQIRAARGGLRPGSVSEAEREAEHIGRAAAAYGAVVPPLSVLPLTARVADSGAASGAAMPAADFAEDGGALVEQVMRAYPRRRQEIIRHLSSLVVTDDDVERVLRILEPLPFVTATALIASLPEDDRRILIANINPPHVLRFRREVLAAFGAMTHSIASAVDLRVFRRMSLDGLSRPEWEAAIHALRVLPEEDLAKLERRRRSGPAIRRLVAQPGPAGGAGPSVGDEILRLVRMEAEDKVVGRQPQAKALLEALAPLLARGDEEGRRAALARIAQGGEEGSQGYDDATLRWAVAELDAQGLVEPLLRETSVATRGDRQLRPAFLAVARARRGDLNLRLVEDLLDTSFWGLDWSVTDNEAILAFDILTAMPPVDVDRFRHLEGGALLRKLYDQLPGDYLRKASVDAGAALLRGIEVAAGEDGLTDQGERLGRVLHDALQADPEILEIVRRVDRDGVPDSEAAYALLVKLADLAGPAPSDTGTFDDRAAAFARRKDRLHALVRYLDMRGHIETLFDRLGDGTLQDPDSWPMLTAVIAARDPVLVEMHARRLLSETRVIVVVDSVSRAEALLAFQMVRVLPAGRRAVLEAADGGALWDRMIGRMTPEMRAAGGLSYSLAQPDANGETPLRRRLANPDLWTAANADQIIVLVELSIAAGDYAFAFRASKRFAAYRDAELLSRVVTPYLLYDPDAPDRDPPGERPRTFPQRMPVDAPDDEKGWLRALANKVTLAFGGRWMQGDAVIGLPFARAYDATFDLEQALPLWNDSPNNDLLGYGELADTRAENQTVRPRLNKTSIAELRDSSANLLRLEFSSELGIARVTSKALRLENAVYLSSGLTLRTGPVAIDDLRLEIRFVGGDLRQPSRMSMTTSSVAAETPVVTADDLLAGARDLRVHDLHLAAAWEQALLPGMLGYVFSIAIDAIPLVGRLSDPRSPGEIADDVLSRNPMFAAATLSFSRFAVNEIHLGSGQRIAGVSVKDFFGGLAGNRAEHARNAHRVALRLHRAALARAAAAKQRGDLERYEREMTMARGEFAHARDALLELERLTAAEGRQSQEARLHDLVRTMSRRGGGLDEPEEKELADLQSGDAVGAQGGAAFFLGELKLSGIEGGVTTDDITISNAGGAGESAGMVVQQLTTTVLLEKLRAKELPGRSRLEVAEGDIRFTGAADDIAITGIAIKGAIPTSAELRDRIADLPEDASYDKERARLGALQTKLAEYEDLKNKPLLLRPNAYFGRTVEEERRLNALERELSREFGTTAESVTIASPEIGFGDGDRKLSFGAGKVEVKNLRRDGLTLDSLVAEDVKGAFGLTDAGLELSGFAIDSIALAGLDWQGEGSRIWSRGETIMTGITAHLTVPFLPHGGGLAGLDTSAVDIHKLTIAEVQAAKLGYTALREGTRTRYYSVEVDGGTIGGIEATDFKIRTDIWGAYDFTGELRIQRFDKAGFVAGFKSLVEAEGTLSGPGGDTADQTPAITVKFAKEAVGDVDPETGERRTLDVMTVDLNQLLFSETGADITPVSGKGNVRIRRADLTGKIRMVGGDGVEGSSTRYDTTYFEDVALGSIVMSKMRWRSNAGMKIDADGETTIRDVAVSGRYIAAAETAHIHLDQVRVGMVEAESLYYQDSDTALWITRVEENPTEPGLKLVDITALDVHIRQDEAGTKLVGGRFAVQQAVAEFALTYGEDLGVMGELDAKEITLKVEREGQRIEARARDIDGDLGISKGDFHTDLTLVDFDTGDIVKSGNVWTVGGLGGDALQIRQVRIRGLELDSPDVKVTSLHGLPAMLSNTRARFEIHLHPNASAKKEAGTPFEKAVIRELWIDDVLGSGLAVWLKKYNFGLVLAEENDASLQDVHLTGPLSDTGEPFTITPRKGGDFAVAGQVRTSNLHVDELYVQLKDRLRGVLTLSADTLDIAFLADAGAGLPFQVDLRNWTARDILLYAQEDPKRALSILTSQADEAAGIERQVSGDWISYDSASGELIFDRVEIDGLLYDDKVLGVFLDIDKITAPRGNPIILSTAVEREEWKDQEGNPLPGMAIYLDRLEITGADFDIKDLSRFIPESTGPAEPPSAFLVPQSLRDWIDANEALFLSMDLSIQTQSEESIDIPGLPAKVGVNVTFRRGRVDYREIDIQVNALPDWPLGFDAERFYSEELRLEAGEKDILRWDVPHSEGHMLGTFREVTLNRLLHAQLAGWEAPGPDDTPEPFNTREIVVEDIEIGLDISNARDLPISLGGTGTIVLDRQALSSLHIEGDLQRLTDEVVLQHAGSVTSRTRALTKELVERPGQFAISLGDLRIKEVDLTIPVEDALGPAELTTGGIHISGVTDTTLDFEGLNPRRLKGRVTSAEANKVRFVMPPAKPKEPGKAGGGGGKGP